jgi:hypothetical protein
MGLKSEELETLGMSKVPSLVSHSHPYQRWPQVKFSCHCPQTQWHEDIDVNGGKAPRTPIHGTRWRRMISCAFRPLYLQGKSCQCQLYRRTGGTGRCEEEKISPLSSNLPIIPPRCSYQFSRYSLIVDNNEVI